MNQSAVKQHYQNEEIARTYDEDRSASLRVRTVNFLERRAFLKALRAARRETPQPRVLDAPCGTGRVTRWLLDDGLDVLGGDISAPMLEIGRDKLSGYGGRVELRQLDLERLDLPDAAFDLVSCVRLFNHCGRA